MKQDANYWINRPLDDNQRDWQYNNENWIRDYLVSSNHPHRELIIGILKQLSASNLLEVGCNAGPNLIAISYMFRLHPFKLYGIDVNKESIGIAWQNPVAANLEVADVKNIPALAKSFDIVLSDAVLMYISDEKINDVMKEIDRVTKKAIIIVDRVKGNEHIWGRDYGKLLENLRYKVETIKITEKDWPESENWQKYGYLWMGVK